MSRVRLTVFIGLIVSLSVGLQSVIAAEARDSNELRFGSVAMDIPAAMHKRLRPLTDYLSQELKQPVTLRLSSNLSAASDDVARGVIDIAYLTPVAYINAYKNGAVRLVAKTRTKGQSSFRLMLVVREDSPIQSVRELAGKSFAFGDPAAILQRAVIVNAGTKLEQLGSYKFIGHYDNIARGVISGDFDAGVLKDTTAYAWEKKGLRILHVSPELPPYNIVVSRHVSEQRYQDIRQAFLRLDAVNPEHLMVIKSLDPNYNGFAPVSDSDYDVVRMLVKPFSKDP